MPVNEYDRIVAVKRQVEKDLLKIPGVHGVSIGCKISHGKRTHDLAIVVHLSRKLPMDQIPAEEQIPPYIQGFRTDVLVHEQMSPHVNSNYYRPLKGGCQIVLANNDGSIGTFGALVTRQSDNAVCLLTNQHVLPVMGVVYQPTVQSGNEIADVAAQVLTPNVDAAIATLRSGVGAQNWVLNVGAVQGMYTVTGDDMSGDGYPVQKCGCNTGWTNGLVTNTVFSGVRTDGWQFEDQLFVTPEAQVNASFSQPGDSGSVLVDAQWRVVGLLWGGNGSYGGASPIADVTAALGVTVVDTAMPWIQIIHEGYNQNETWICQATYDNSVDFPDTRIQGANGKYYGTSAPPAVVAFREQLYCFHQGQNDGWTHWGIRGATGWSADTLCPDDDHAFGTSGSPALAVFRGKLYCARQKQGGGDDAWIYCANTADGVNWTTDALLPNPQKAFGTYGPPALVVFQGRLYCMREGQGDSGWMWCASTADGVNWTTNALLPNPQKAFGTSGPPALATYRGVLYCVHEGQGNSGLAWCATYDGTTWSGVQPIPSKDHPYQTLGPPALVVYNDTLYCIRAGTIPGSTMLATFNGTTWSSPDTILTQNGTFFQTSGRPALCVCP